MWTRTAGAMSLVVVLQRGPTFGNIAKVEQLNWHDLLYYHLVEHSVILHNIILCYHEYKTDPSSDSMHRSNKLGQEKQPITLEE